MKFKDFSQLSLPDILKEKDVCLAILKPKIYKQLVEQYNLLPLPQQEEIKSIILKGIETAIIIREKTKKKMEQVQNEAIDFVKQDFTKRKRGAYKAMERKVSSQDQQEAEDIILKM